MGSTGYIRAHHTAPIMLDKEPIVADASKGVPGVPGVVAVPEDPAAPSVEASSKRQRLSDIFTIVRLSLFCSILGEWGARC